MRNLFNRIVTHLCKYCMLVVSLKKHTTKTDLQENEKNSKFIRLKFYVMEKIQIIRDSLIISGFCLGIIKVLISWKSFWKSNDISRRKIALDGMNTWTKNLTKKSSLARKIVETFSDEQCKSLKKEDEIKIDNKYEKSLKLYFNNETLKTENGYIILDEGQSSILRWEIITYLNSLENVLTSWRHNISDKDIIEEQFGYLYDAEENHTTLQTFRKIIGINSYPSINEFVKELEKKSNIIKSGKSK